MIWLLRIVGWVTGSKVGRWVGMAAGAVMAVLGIFLAGQRDGRKNTISKVKEADNERADAIRDNVERNLADRVRRYDGRGFRDETAEK